MKYENSKHISVGGGGGERGEKRGGKGRREGERVREGEGERKREGGGRREGESH